MIVEAFKADTTIDVGTRRSGTFHQDGYSTKLVSYLDKTVEQRLLISPTAKASGALVISDLLNAYLDDASLIMA